MDGHEVAPVLCSYTDHDGPDKKSDNFLESLRLWGFSGCDFRCLSVHFSGGGSKNGVGVGMLHKFEGDEHGIIEITHSDGVRAMTGRGWKLLAILEAEVVVSKEEEVAPLPPEPGTFPTAIPTANPTYTRHFTETRFTYVLAQPKDQRIDDLVEERDKAINDLAAQWERTNELETDVANLTKQVEGGTEIESQLEGDLAKARAAVQEANDKASEEERSRKEAVTAGNKAAKRYREHMETLWQELGAARMRELLGHDMESPIPLPKPKTAMERIAEDGGPVGD